MRIWTLDDSLLDTKGLVAHWREALLAQSALIKGEGGYSKHPQLDRFKLSECPYFSIATRLWLTWCEADDRGYKFNQDKIHNFAVPAEPIAVTEGQVEYELDHLYIKLCKRDPERADLLCERRENESLQDLVAKMFWVVPGPVEEWEKVLPQRMK